MRSRPRTTTQQLLLGLLLVAAALSTARAQHQLTKILSDKSINLWQDVLQIAGVQKQVQAPPARFVAFVPTDAAVRTFLKGMGLTMKDLAARPNLAKHLVAEHVVLGVPPEAQKALLAGQSARLATAGAAPGTNHSGVVVEVQDPGALQQGGARLVARDAQGGVTRSTEYVRLDPNKLLVMVDRVLMSGHYYDNFASLCKHRGAAAAPMCEALTRSGVLPDLTDPGFADTVFFPARRAFEAAALQPSRASVPSLSTLVKYHIVPGLHAFPEGFVSGSSYATLLGSDAKLGILHDSVPGLPGGPDLEGQNLTAYVIPADQQRVPVVVYNVFVGRGIAQGIPALLLPPGFKSGASVPAKAAAAPQPRAAVGPAVAGVNAGPAPSKAAVTRQGGAGRRRLHAFPEAGKVTMPLNAAETDIRAQVRSKFREDDARWR